MIKLKISIFLLLLTAVYCDDDTCPGPSQTNFTSTTEFTMTYDMWRNITYINKVGDMEGFTTIKGYDNTAYPQYAIRFNGPGIVSAYPSSIQSYMTLPNNVNFTLQSGYKIVYNGTENVTIYHNSAIIYYLFANFTLLEGNVCAGITYQKNASTFIGVCSEQGAVVIPSDLTMNCSSYNSSCYPCDCDCSSCFGPGSGTCRSCKAGVLNNVYNSLYYTCGFCYVGFYEQPTYSNPNNKQCFNYCPNGYFPNKTTLKCDACDPSCTRCSGPGNLNVCITCAVGYYYYLYPSKDDGSCLRNCPSDTAVFPGSSTCSNCHSICSTCSYPGSNTNCTSCKFPYYLQPASGACLQSCPTSYYANKTTLKCTACDASCSSCTGSGPDACLSCNTNYYLQPHSTSCRSTCPPGYHLKAGPNLCLPCDSRCSNCIGFRSTECIACNLGYYLQPSSSGISSCRTTCPAGYYPDPTTSQCTPCSAACAVCFDSTETNCTACTSGYYLSPNSTVCSQSCPTGYWADATTHTCAPCHEACSSCTGPSKSQCESCHPGYYLQWNSTKCLKGCVAPGYWPDPLTNLCATCSAECKSCSGPFNTQCTSCNSGFFLQPHSTTCSYLCPAGYYPDSQVNVCYPCSTGCAICTGGTNSVCSQCKRGYYFQPGSTQCSISCPSEYFADNSTQSCRKCNVACASCTGSSYSACITCNPGYYMQPNSTACKDSCPSEYVANPTGTCDLDLNGTIITYIESSRDAFWNAWSFWTPFGFIFWLCLTLILIKTLLYKVCLVQKLKGDDDSAKETGSFKKHLVAFAVMHPLVSIYVYKDPLVGKIYRSMLYFVRCMTVLAFSAAFITLNSNYATFTLQLKRFEAKQLIAPFFVVLPIHGILERIIRGCKRGQITHKRKMAEGKQSSLSVSARKTLRMTFMLLMLLAALVVVFAISQHLNYLQQISWAACFLKIMLQDLIVYPIIAFVWNCIVINGILFNKKVPKFLKNSFKNVIDEGMLNTFESLKKKKEKKTLDSSLKGSRLISISNPTEEIDMQRGKSKGKRKLQGHIQEEDGEEGSIINTMPQKGKKTSTDGIIDLENNEEIHVHIDQSKTAKGRSNHDENGAKQQETSKLSDRAKVNKSTQSIQSRKPASEKESYAEDDEEEGDEDGSEYEDEEEGEVEEGDEGEDDGKEEGSEYEDDEEEEEEEEKNEKDKSNIVTDKSSVVPDSNKIEEIGSEEKFPSGSESKIVDRSKLVEKSKAEESKSEESKNDGDEEESEEGEENEEGDEDEDEEGSEYEDDEEYEEEESKASKVEA